MRTLSSERYRSSLTSVQIVNVTAKVVGIHLSLSTDIGWVVALPQCSAPPWHLTARAQANDFAVSAGVPARQAVGTPVSGSPSSRRASAAGLASSQRGDRQPTVTKQKIFIAICRPMSQLILLDPALSPFEVCSCIRGRDEDVHFPGCTMSKTGFVAAW